MQIENHNIWTQQKEHNSNHQNETTRVKDKIYLCKILPHQLQTCTSLSKLLLLYVHPYTSAQAARIKRLSLNLQYASNEEKGVG